MKLKNMSIEELELLSYTDLTNMVLREKKKPMNTPTIFKEICNLLGFDENKYNDLIGDYYTSLTIDKRFVLLDNHEWDLAENHAVTIELDDEEEEIEPEEDDEEIDFEEDNIEESLDDEEIEDDDVVDDDLEDLSMVDEEEV